MRSGQSFVAAIGLARIRLSVPPSRLVG